MTKALFGYATRFNQIVPHNGKNILLLPDVFCDTLNSGAMVRLLLNHQDSDCIGSTYDILQLYSDQYGLAFRAQLPNSPLGRCARQMAESNDHNCMSILFDYHGATKEIRKIDGSDVVVIVAARLWEISYLHGNGAGVVKDAFAQYADVDYSKTLKQECSGGKYLCDSAAMNVTRALNNLMNRV